MSKLVIFDGNAIMHRAYHALPPLKTKKDEPINAVYGLVSMLLKVIQDLEPTHVVFAFDRPEPTFRKKILEEYQAHRPEMDKDLGSQFEKAYETLKAFGIPIYSKAGYEADDVIGTMANRAEASEILIVTGDRDMLQLVNEKVKLYMPGRSLSDAVEYNAKKATEKMGVPPKQVVDLKALTGDQSDNYKGVPGIGPKTAIKLLEEYGDLENIYKVAEAGHASKHSPRTKKLLEEYKESAFQSQDLARIRIDVDIEFDLSAAGKFKADSPEVLMLFEEYGFRTLTRRVREVGEKIASKHQQTLL